jgi:hypothetical protein
MNKEARHDEAEARCDSRRQASENHFELPASVFRDLQTYADLLTKTTGTAAPIDPSKLIAPMLERFMATDRVFAKARKPTALAPGIR